MTQRDYTLIAIASLALAGLALTRTYLRPLPLHRRVLVGIRERVGR